MSSEEHDGKLPAAIHHITARNYVHSINAGTYRDSGHWSESAELNPYLVDSLSQWIKINVFSAPLTALNVVNSTPQVGTLYDMFLEEREVREDPVSITCLSPLRESTHLGLPCALARMERGIQEFSVSYQGPSSKERCLIGGGRNATCGIEVE